MSGLMALGMQSLSDGGFGSINIGPHSDAAKPNGDCRTMHIVPVVIAGGAGTRLWPVSRESFPKPFMRLSGDRSLLQRTLQRAAPLASGEAIVVANREYYFKLVEEVEELRRLGFTPTVTYLLEPCGRNTAPAIAAAATLVQERFGGDAVMLVLPADHLIADQAAFEAAARLAIGAAAQGEIALFGIQPTAPETGFGYIEVEAAPESAIKTVKRFVEKPDRQTALSYLDAGTYLWNSGMFCFRADTFLASLRGCAPAVDDAVQAVWRAVPEDLRRSGAKVDLPEEAFAAVPEISVDYAVMEKAERLAAVPGNFGWSDIGSWAAVSSTFEPDAHGNTAQGNALFVGSTNTHAQSAERLIAAVGLENLLIVDTEDAVLVAHKDKSQDVKSVVAQLKARNDDSVKLHRTVHRPWGSYTVLMEGPRFKIKRIEVKPGASLSLQMHYQRSEHWIVVSGTAKVVNGEREYLVPSGESTFISVGNSHRLSNPGRTLLSIIEVQCGDYLGEDDIVRLADTYGRQ
jgi:mannose-1-phosphate guanylyltransferase/mannose-6-phosphate isomerase